MNSLPIRQYIYESFENTTYNLITMENKVVLRETVTPEYTDRDLMYSGRHYYSFIPMHGVTIYNGRKRKIKDKYHNYKQVTLADDKKSWETGIYNLGPGRLPVNIFEHCGYAELLPSNYSFNVDQPVLCKVDFLDNYAEFIKDGVMIGQAQLITVLDGEDIVLKLYIEMQVDIDRIEISLINLTMNTTEYHYIAQIDYDTLNPLVNRYPIEERDPDDDTMYNTMYDSYLNYVTHNSSEIKHMDEQYRKLYVYRPKYLNYRDIDLGDCIYADIYVTNSYVSRFTRKIYTPDSDIAQIFSSLMKNPYMNQMK